ncbi:YjbR [Bifidobacterium dolichotidis]|uniref:YjbR n=1 Tax=Bifidobacterium dolichotidis TaxID=2306976 RepID=A0A430FS33_9BIFI|nr:MmcQ/YjbR family DNA-binding protein [Bifidobacterium dolichotidis]RSX55663.1 YjbR [Bifidobacterium dolichotidis]
MEIDPILDYCKATYGTLPDRPWMKYPDYLVFRHADTGKWYMLIMEISAQKLGLASDEPKWVANLKCPPTQIDDLVQKPGILHAYHMNKKHWISVLLDGTVAQAEIQDLIDQSYELTE